MAECSSAAEIWLTVAACDLAGGGGALHHCLACLAATETDAVIRCQRVGIRLALSLGHRKDQI
eukprot:815345-Alexandrium_andersonii.AAC.1